MPEEKLTVSLEYDEFVALVRAAAFWLKMHSGIPITGDDIQTLTNLLTALTAIGKIIDQEWDLSGVAIIEIQGQHGHIN